MILRSPTDHPKTAGSHIPPKNFVCCIPSAVSQTSVNPKGMKQHNKCDMNEKCTSLFQAVSQLNVYHSLQQKMQIMIMIKIIIIIIMDTNEKIIS